MIGVSFSPIPSAQADSPRTKTGTSAPKVDIENGELWLINSYVSLYTQAQNFGHEERRRRKLLVSKKQISKLWQAKGRQAMTIVALKMYFNDKGKVKLLIGTAKGKKQSDKRETEKKRDWNRQKSRLLRDHS